jgi:hypothetical protein
MKKMLKNSIALESNLKIYVPSTVNVNEMVDTEGWVDEAMMLLAKCFGGATTHRALGCWVTASGQLVKEKISIVEAYTNTFVLEEQIEVVHDFCIKMKRELKQESIALELNGVLHLL